MEYVYMYAHLPALFFFLFGRLRSAEINLTSKGTGLWNQDWKLYGKSQMTDEK